MYGGREALPDDHKFRCQRGRVRARYRRPHWAAGLKKQARRHSERPTDNSPPGHVLVKLRRSRRQVSARRKLHRAVDAQVATANSIPWSSTAKFSRNGVLVAPLRVSYSLTGNYARATSSLTIRVSSAPPHRIAPHLDPMGVVHQPVEDAVGQRRIADLFVPGWPGSRPRGSVNHLASNCRSIGRVDYVRSAY